MEPLFDKVARKMNARGVSPQRVFGVMSFTAAVIFVLCVALVTMAGDMESDPAIPEQICGLVLGVIAWPVALAFVINGNLSDSFILPLFCVSVLFWVVVVEVFVVFWRWSKR